MSATAAIAAAAGASRRPPPTLVPRSPLVLPPGSYDRVLPWTPPTSRDFLRADWWGVPVYNNAGAPLPFVAGVPGSGGSSEHPERLLTGLDYKYDRAAWWPVMVNRHLVRGFTHWLRWWPNARDDGRNAIAQFVDDCGRLKRLGMPYVVVSLGAKPFAGDIANGGDPRDQSAQQWKDRVGPVLEALLAAHVVDEFVPAFEIDLFNVPGAPTIDYCRWVGQQAHAHGSTCWLHFSPGKTSWFADGDPRGRFGFWDDLGGDVDGVLYQTGPYKDASGRALRAPWTIQETQARIVDTLSQFGRQGNRHKFRLGEDLAWLQFSLDRDDLGQPVDEDEGRLRGYLACCTIDNVSRTDAKVWGAGGGLSGLQGEAI